MGDEYIDDIIIQKLEVACKAHHNGWLNGRKIFELHDTYGLPFSTIKDECEKRGAHFDESGIHMELNVCYGWTTEKIELELRD